MNVTSYFIIYLIIFRLAIIAAGILTVFWGYRLFCKGIWPAGDKSTFDAKLANARFTLKNAAPGTFFALFGIIVISIMLYQGNPELTLKNVKNAENIESKELYLRKYDINKVNQINQDYKDGYITVDKAYDELYNYLKSEIEK